MKAFVNIDDRKVEVELTPEQEELIRSHKYGDYRDIKTFEDACLAVGIEWIDPESLPDDVVAYMKLRIICQALNGGKWMDYSDTDETKYYPWFNASGSGVGFSFNVYFNDRSGSTVGSRLVFESREMAKYAGNQFLDIYNQYIN
jgi:hypothetical protein